MQKPEARASGGLSQLLVAVIMMSGGGYLLLNAIIVRPNFGLRTAIFSVGGLPVTSGMILIPFLFGVGMIFYSNRSWLGWLLAGGSLVALVFGVISNLNLRIVPMSAFELVVILVLLVGGIGLLLRALKDRRADEG